MTAVSVDYKTIIELVDQLPIRQQFELVYDILKRIESTSSDPKTVTTDISHSSLVSEAVPTGQQTQVGDTHQWLGNDFWESLSVYELAQRQAVTPIDNIDALRTNDWPDDELIDEFVTTLQTWHKNQPAAQSVGESVRRAIS